MHTILFPFPAEAQKEMEVRLEFTKEEMDLIIGVTIYVFHSGPKVACLSLCSYYTQNRELYNCINCIHIQFDYPNMYSITV